MASQKRPTRPSALRLLRKKKGLRSVHLAAKADISTQQLHNLETGTNLPMLATAQKLAAALGVSVDDIFPPRVA